MGKECSQLWHSTPETQREVDALDGGERTQSLMHTLTCSDHRGRTARAYLFTLTLRWC